MRTSEQKYGFDCALHLCFYETQGTTAICERVNNTYNMQSIYCTIHCSHLLIWQFLYFLMYQITSVLNTESIWLSQIPNTDNVKVETNIQTQSKHKRWIQKSRFLNTEPQVQTNRSTCVCVCVCSCVFMCLKANAFCLTSTSICQHKLI